MGGNAKRLDGREYCERLKIFYIILNIFFWINPTAFFLICIKNSMILCILKQKIINGFEITKRLLYNFRFWLRYFIDSFMQC
jgi:hypothetical protein